MAGQRLPWQSCPHVCQWPGQPGSRVSFRARVRTPACSPSSPSESALAWKRLDLRGPEHRRSPGRRDLRLGKVWDAHVRRRERGRRAVSVRAPSPARTYQMKSVQWLQKVGCLKKRAMNLWSFTSCTFFCRSAPLRAKRLATS